MLKYYPFPSVRPSMNSSRIHQGKQTAVIVQQHILLGRTAALLQVDISAVVLTGIEACARWRETRTEHGGITFVPLRAFSLF